MAFTLRNNHLACFSTGATIRTTLPGCVSALCAASNPETVVFPVCLPQQRILRGCSDARICACQSSGMMPTEVANSTGSASTATGAVGRYVSRTRRISLTNAKLTLQLLELPAHVGLFQLALYLYGPELDVLQGNDGM